MAAFKIDYDNSKLNGGLDNMRKRFGYVVLMYATTKAVFLQAKMKRDRPWTDQTGMAKATLNAKVSQPNDHIVRITLAHGVSYGVDLELAHGKRYAIVGPTLETEGPRVVSDLTNLLERSYKE